MAIGWLSVLKGVPWGDVIGNAPKVADGAKKLWGTVSKKASVPEPAAPHAPPDGRLDAQSIGELRSRVEALEATAAGVHAQMLASSEVIKSLAEQNAALIKAVDAARVRLGWLASALVVVAIFAVVGIALALRN